MTWPPPDLATRANPQPTRPEPWSPDYDAGYEAGFVAGVRFARAMAELRDAARNPTSSGIVTYRERWVLAGRGRALIQINPDGDEQA